MASCSYAPSMGAHKVDGRSIEILAYRPELADYARRDAWDGAGDPAVIGTIAALFRFPDLDDRPPRSNVLDRQLIGCLPGSSRPPRGSAANRWPPARSTPRIP